MKVINHIIALVAAAALGVAAISCGDGKTYAQLLNDETMYCNNFLADQRVVNEIPADSVFEYGPDAPYYRIDPDGNLYMQVVYPGTEGNKVEAGELIYFRFTRYNLQGYADGQLPVGEGNNVDVAYGNVCFRYDDYSAQFSYQWGTGIQRPLAFLPVDCKVNLVIKSQLGIYSEVAYVTPYLYTLTYYRPKI